MVYRILVGATADRCAITGPLRCNAQAHDRARQEWRAAFRFQRVRAQPPPGGWFQVWAAWPAVVYAAFVVEIHSEKVVG